MTHYLFRDDLIHVCHGHGSSSYFFPSILVVLIISRDLRYIWVKTWSIVPKYLFNVSFKSCLDNFPKWLSSLPFLLQMKKLSLLHFDQDNDSWSVCSWLTSSYMEDWSDMKYSVNFLAFYAREHSSYWWQFSSRNRVVMGYAFKEVDAFKN